MKDHKKLAALIKDVYEQEINADILAYNNEVIIPSKGFTDKMSRLCSTVDHPLINIIYTYRKQTACFVFVILAFICIYMGRSKSAFPDDPAAQPIVQTDAVQSEFIDEYEKDEKCQIETDIPDGFVLKDHDEQNDSAFVFYQKNEKYIYIKKYRYSISSSPYYIPNEIEMDVFGDNDGYEYTLFKNATEDSYSCIWNDGKYTCELHSNLDKKQVIDLCIGTKKEEHPYTEKYYSVNVTSP